MFFIELCKQSVDEYHLAAMAFSSSAWQLRADKATMEFCGSSSGTISNCNHNITHRSHQAQMHTICYSYDMHVCACAYLWSLFAVFNLTGIEALLLWVLHAGKHPCAAEAYWVNCAFFVKVRSICNDLKTHTITARFSIIWTEQNNSTVPELYGIMYIYYLEHLLTRLCALCVTMYPDRH